MGTRSRHYLYTIAQTHCEWPRLVLLVASYICCTRARVAFQTGRKIPYPIKKWHSTNNSVFTYRLVLHV